MPKQKKSLPHCHSLPRMICLSRSIILSKLLNTELRSYRSGKLSGFTNILPCTNFFWYHFSISYTPHITANKHLYIHCPKNIKSDIDGIMDYLAEANHDILVGFSEENRLAVQEKQGNTVTDRKVFRDVKKEDLGDPLFRFCKSSFIFLSHSLLYGKNICKACHFKYFHNAFCNIEQYHIDLLFIAVFLPVLLH